MQNNKNLLVAIIVFILVGGVGAATYVIRRSQPEPVGTRVINGKEYPLYENKDSDSKVFRYEPIPIK